MAVLPVLQFLPFAGAEVILVDEFDNAFPSVVGL